MVFSGSFQGKFQPAGTLGLFHDFLDQRFFDVTIWCFDNASSTSSYMSKKKVEKKLTKCININAACGYWENGLFRQFPSTNVHYKALKKQTRYDSEGFQKLRTLLLYGDSHAIRYYKSLLDKPACSSIFLKCDYVFTFVYQREKYRPILDDINYFDGKDFNKTIFLSDIKDAFYRDDMDSSESVIVINFGIHLMMTMSLNQAKDLFIEFLNIITTLRAKKKEGEFPIVIWRTTPPPALENEKELRNATHTRFLTKQVWTTLFFFLLLVYVLMQWYYMYMQINMIFKIAKFPVLVAFFPVSSFFLANPYCAPLSGTSSNTFSVLKFEIYIY